MDFLNIVSTAISIVSLGIVIYKEFFEGPRLTSAVDQVVTLRLSEIQKSELLMDMLVDDLLGAVPSAVAQHTLAASAPVRAAALTGQRDAVKAALVALAARGRISYDPTENQIGRYFADTRFALALYLPVIVANSGKRVGHVSSLVLVAELRGRSRQRFVFSAMAEIDPVRFMKRHEAQVDSDRVSGVFPGFSVAPSASITVHALMAPMLDIAGRPISKTYLQPGKYRLTLFGYGQDGGLLLRSKSVECEWREANFVQAFMGAESVNFLTMEANITDALRLLDSDPALAPWP